MTDSVPFKDFIATKKQMKAKDFGELIRDLAWEDEEDTEFLVYQDAWYIEILKDGSYLLTLENLQWSGDTEDDLHELEVKLHEFTVNYQ